MYTVLSTRYYGIECILSTSLFYLESCFCFVMPPGFSALRSEHYALQIISIASFAAQRMHSRAPYPASVFDFLRTTWYVTSTTRSCIRTGTVGINHNSMVVHTVQYRTTFIAMLFYLLVDLVGCVNSFMVSLTSIQSKDTFIKFIQGEDTLSYFRFFLFIPMSLRSSTTVQALTYSAH